MEGAVRSLEVMVCCSISYCMVEYALIATDRSRLPKIMVVHDYNYDFFMCIKTSKGEAMVELYKSRSKQRGRVGEVLNKLLKKRYPEEMIDRVQNLESDGSDILTFDELIEWDLWPCYLTVYSECTLMLYIRCILHTLCYRK